MERMARIVSAGVKALKWMTLALGLSFAATAHAREAGSYKVTYTKWTNEGTIVVNGKPTEKWKSDAMGPFLMLRYTLNSFRGACQNCTGFKVVPASKLEIESTCRDEKRAYTIPFDECVKYLTTAE